MVLVSVQDLFDFLMFSIRVCLSIYNILPYFSVISVLEFINTVYNYDNLLLLDMFVL